MQYRAPLDGLRALCAGAVFFFHASYGRGGGFIGVDVFFVLSGYLITRILLEDIHQAGAVRFRRFYVRRARRLLPAVLVALGLVVALWRWVGHGDRFAAILPPVLLYYVNWLQAFGHEIQALPHFWSLSVEEQFYLLWPLALSGLVRLGRGYVAAAIGCLILAFATARALAPGHGTIVAALFGYYSTFARVDELLVGALLAVLHGSPNLHIREATARAARLLVWPATVGLVACLIWGCVYGDRLLRGGFTAIAVASGMIVVHCSSGEATLLNRFLQTPALVAIGRRAYGIYVFHYPIIRALEPLRGHGTANWAIVTALRGVATLALAWASYNLIESRFLAPRTLPSYSLSSTPVRGSGSG